MTHNTTPSEELSGSGATEAVDQGAQSLFEFRDRPTGVAHVVAEVSQLRPEFVQLYLRWDGRRSLHDVGPALLPDHDPALLLKESDRGLCGVERDSVLGHQRPVRGQPRADVVCPAVDLRPEQLGDAATRRSAALVIHAAEGTPPVLRQRLTGETEATYCPDTVVLYATLSSEEECMDAGACAANPDSPTGAELAAMQGELPYPQRRAVWDHWERVLAECRAEVRGAPRPTAALLDGTAAERRYRRMERRALAAVVRELPVRQRPAGPSGSEAA